MLSSVFLMRNCCVVMMPYWLGLRAWNLTPHCCPGAAVVCPSSHCVLCGSLIHDCDKCKDNISCLCKNTRPIRLTIFSMFVCLFIYLISLFFILLYNRREMQRRPCEYLCHFNCSVVGLLEQPLNDIFKKLNGKPATDFQIMFVLQDGFGSL